MKFHFEGDTMTDLSDLTKLPEYGDEPPMNKALNDVLAMGGMDRESQVETLRAWLMLGAERLAREAGRGKARDQIRNLDGFLRDADPVRPWPT